MHRLLSVSLSSILFSLKRLGINLSSLDPDLLVKAKQVVANFKRNEIEYQLSQVLNLPLVRRNNDIAIDKSMLHLS